MICRSERGGAAHRSRRGHPRLRLACRRPVRARRAPSRREAAPGEAHRCRAAVAVPCVEEHVARDSRRARPPRARGHGPERAGRRLAVITSELPNGRAGWLDTGSGNLRFSRTRVTLDVDLSARELRVRGGGRVLRRMRVGIGARGTPTPTGRFAITDKLRGSDFSASAYGCCILALSGHQTSLPRGWTGGDRLAIHEGSTAGAVSTGCLHAAARDLVWLMRSVPLGAQITVHP